MAEDNIESNDLPNVEIEEVLEETQEDDSEDVDTLKAKNQSLYEQLKKAKGYARNNDGEWVKKETPVKVVESVSTKDVGARDLYALSQANVHIDDFDDVVEYASFKKLSIADALKSDVIKTVLANKSEYRKTAELTNTGGAKRSASKVSDDTLQTNLSEGKVPEKGSEEAERLFWARRGGKR